MQEPTGIAQGNYWIKIQQRLLFYSHSTGLNVGHYNRTNFTRTSEKCEKSEELETISSFTLQEVVL
jgi:hypothetical protein